MSRFEAHPRPIVPPVSPPETGALVQVDGRTMFVLGRTMSGYWKLLPMTAFGTTAARSAVVTTTIQPTLAHAAAFRTGRPPRDRRTAWMRR